MKIFQNYGMAYCYDKDCSARTKEHPYPYGKIATKKGTIRCPHCGKKMTNVASLSDGNYDY